MSELERSRPQPPVRALHLGLGNFFRAHQAWFTHSADDGGEWGIAAFTGRSARAAEVLARQDGLYTLDVRDVAGDSFEVVESLAAVHAAADVPAWVGYWADPTVTYLTMTVTEAGYRRDGIAGRIVAGLMARRVADAGPIALIPCDNLPANGSVLAEAVGAVAERLDPTLVGWIEGSVTFISTVVDRITPATTDSDRARIVAATGFRDESPVVTEPFVEWVLASSTGVTVPRWETAGARWVEDTTPYEARKLMLLNGGHSLLAYAGPLRGHRTVAEAIADHLCRAWVEQWWDEARAYVPLSDPAVHDYRASLLDRWANPAIEHRLAQIAMDGSQKLPARILPTVRAERAAGRLPLGASRVLAAWVLSLRAPGGPAPDPRADELVGLSSGELGGAVPRVIGALDEALSDDHELVAAVVTLAEELKRS